VPPRRRDRERRGPAAGSAGISRPHTVVSRPEQVYQVAFPIGNLRRAERTGSLLYFRSPANLDQISSGSALSRAVLARVVAGLQCFITHWPVGEFFVPAE